MSEKEKAIEILGFLNREDKYIDDSWNSQPLTAYMAKRIQYPLNVGGMSTGDIEVRWRQNFDNIVFTISLIFDRLVLIKVVVDPYVEHLNPSSPVASQARSWEKHIEGPHFFSWPDNRVFVATQNESTYLRIARKLPAEVGTDYESVFRWVATKSKIKLKRGQEIPNPMKKNAWR
ncbi:MAG: hypothetical protein ACPGOV_13800 [Magnetovibrionaceae bacterium]